jgi:hypothetical protein
MQDTYRHSVLSRSWSDSWELVAGNKAKTVFIGLGILVLPILLKRCVLHAETKSALTDFLFGALALAFVWVLFFLAHIFYFTPKKIYEEQLGLIAELNSKIADLQERLRPKLKMTCDPNYPGCSQRSPRVQWLRIAVNTDGVNSVEECIGHIFNIKKNGTYIWTGDSAAVTFAPGDEPDATCKTIYAGKTEFLDIFGITYEGNELFVATKRRDWRFDPDLRRIFAERGEYFLSVTIAGKSMGQSMPTIQTELKFDWTGNWATSTLSKV